MGCKELIESLKAAGDGKLTALRAESEVEAERVRTGAARSIKALRDEHARKHAAEAAREAETILAEANAEVRAIRLRAERVLAERLHGVARALLNSLRNEGYRDVFIGFAREHPRFTWKTVRVNPDDAALARELFPDAEVLVEQGITGGMEVASEGDQVRVVNTFEKRLERLWEEMLPDIMREMTGQGT